MSVRSRQTTDASVLFQSGKLEHAASMCRRILNKHPRDADALQLMGLIAAQSGAIGLAIQWLGKAIQAAGPRFDLCLNLARLLQANGNPEAAIPCYLQALEAAPRNASVWLALGRLLAALGSEEAAGCFRQVNELGGEPAEVAEAEMQLGHIYHAQGNLEAAAGCYESVLSSDPDSAEAYFNLGVVRTMQGLQREARAAYREAVRLRPHYAEAHNNLGILEQIRGEWDQAARHYRHAIQTRPDYQDPYCNLGLLLQDQDAPEAALGLYDELIARHPHHADAHNNQGNALLALNRIDAARASYQTAVALRQNHAEAHWNLALVYLLTGDYVNGWREYDWRLLRDPNAIPRFDQPFWDGCSYSGKTLLVHAEQGMGDTIQFIRYVRQAKQRGGNLLLLCQPPLAGLLSGCAGIDGIFLERRELPAFDYHVPLLSLPRILGTTLETVPSSVPYLMPDRALVRQWAKIVESRSTARKGWRIGLAWRGNPKHKNDRNRSAPDWFIERIGSPQGVTLFSLQKDGGAIPSNLIPIGEEMADFADTAAVMANLDLVVSVDTAVAHLAGALGRRTWTLLAYAPDWRWMLNREDSSWYPGMRLFRQQSAGDWDGLAATLRRELQQITKNPASRRYP